MKARRPGKSRAGRSFSAFHSSQASASRVNSVRSAGWSEGNKPLRSRIGRGCSPGPVTGGRDRLAEVVAHGPPILKQGDRVRFGTFPEPVVLVVVARQIKCSGNSLPNAGKREHKAGSLANRGIHAKRIYDKVAQCKCITQPIQRGLSTGRCQGSARSLQSRPLRRPSSGRPPPSR